MTVLTFHWQRIALYTLHYTLYIVHSALYTLHCTLYIVHSTLYILHYTLYTIHSTLYTLHCTLYTVHSTLYTLHHTLYTLHSTDKTYPNEGSTCPCWIQDTVICHLSVYTALLQPTHFRHTLHTLNTKSFTMHTLNSTLLSIQSLLFTDKGVKLTVHYTLTYRPSVDEAVL